MANSTPAGVTIWYDDSGGTPVNITAHVLTMGDIDVEEITEEVHPFGTAWEENKGVGIGRVPDIVFGGLYDDGVGGPDDLFGDRIPEGPNATPRTFKVSFIAGSPGKTFSVETILMRYKRPEDRSALGRYEVTLQKAAGAPIET
jgi:hypothetical protein